MPVILSMPARYGLSKLFAITQSVLNIGGDRQNAGHHGAQKWMTGKEDRWHRSSVRVCCANPDSQLLEQDGINPPIGQSYHGMMNVARRGN